MGAGQQCAKHPCRTCWYPQHVCELNVTGKTVAHCVKCKHLRQLLKLFLLQSESIVNFDFIIDCWYSKTHYSKNKLTFHLSLPDHDPIRSPKSKKVKWVLLRATSVVSLCTLKNCTPNCSGRVTEVQVFTCLSKVQILDVNLTRGLFAHIQSTSCSQCFSRIFLCIVVSLRSTCLGNWSLSMRLSRSCC